MFAVQLSYSFNQIVKVTTQHKLVNINFFHRFN
jgi:hypothetical protein